MVKSICLVCEPESLSVKALRRRISQVYESTTSVSGILIADRAILPSLSDLICKNRSHHSFDVLFRGRAMPRSNFHRFFVLH